MKYRKKPVVVEAMQLTKERAFECLSKKQRFAFGLSVNGNWHEERGEVYRAYIIVKTLEGAMRAELDDWIIKGVEGELYPCKPEIFAATYEPA